MHERQDAIARFGDIDLEHTYAAVEIVLHRFDRVLRIPGSRAAAMGRNNDTAIFAQAVEIFGQGKALAVGFDCSKPFSLRRDIG